MINVSMFIKEIHLQVYYKTCPEITQSFATYPETPTGKTEGSIDKVHGSCIQNAVSLEARPFSFCKSDGTWFSSQGGCQCMAGYQVNTCHDRFSLWQIPDNNENF